MKLHVHRFKLNTLTPLQVGAQQISSREGLLFYLSQGNEILGFGEASPLPFVSKESIDTVLSELDRIVTEDSKVLLTRGFFTDSRWSKLLQKSSPSLSWALWNTFRIKSTPWATARVNALLSLNTDQNIIKCVQQIEAQGYSSVKLKVQPRHIDFQADLLRDILSQTKSIHIRLDANQSLTPKDLSVLLKDQTHFRIEYIEEPFKTSIQNLAELKLIQSEYSIPFAFDETVHLREHSLSLLVEQIKKLKLQSMFVLKPMLLGDRLQNIIQLLDRARLPYIISSSYESPVGLFTNICLSSHIRDRDMGLDLTPFDLDWSRYVQKTGATIRTLREPLLSFCQSWPEVRSYELA